MVERSAKPTEVCSRNSPAPTKHTPSLFAKRAVLNWQKRANYAKASSTKDACAIRKPHHKILL